MAVSVQVTAGWISIIIIKIMLTILYNYDAANDPERVYYNLSNTH